MRPSAAHAPGLPVEMTRQIERGARRAREALAKERVIGRRRGRRDGEEDDE